MDPNGTKPEGISIPPMMRQMMEKMCGGAGELDLAALCREMMGKAQKATDAGGWAMSDCCRRPRGSGSETAPAPEPHGPPAA